VVSNGTTKVTTETTVPTPPQPNGVTVESVGTTVAKMTAVSVPLVKSVACIALGAIGVASMFSGRDPGVIVNEVIGGILAVAGMATYAQAQALRKV